MTSGPSMHAMTFMLPAMQTVHFSVGRVFSNYTLLIIQLIQRTS